MTWCDGTEQYVFLSPDGSHHRRSNFARRVLRPAADGQYAATAGRPALPVLVDASAYPGRPLPRWAIPDPGRPFTPPTGRGFLRIPEDTALASWAPAMTVLTPHGYRHGHQTWMDDAGIASTLKHARMGHEVGGVPAIYSHITTAMRTKLLTVLEELWADSLTRRARLSRTSGVLPESDIGPSATS